MDGGANNRKFMKLHAEEGDDWYFHVKNPVQPEKEVIMMMDPCVSYFYSGILQYTYDMISALIRILDIRSKQTKNMYAYTIYTGRPFYVRLLYIKDNDSRSIGFILQHGIKKNRNSFFASKDDPQANRRLRLGSEFSFWSHWVAAYR